MKRFIAITLSLFALFFVADRAAGLVFHYLENKALEHSPYGMVTEYTMWKVDSDVVIIGASDAQHSIVSPIVADSLGMSVYNCGKDGNAFYYQAAMINGILDRYTPKLLIWCLLEYHLSTPPPRKYSNPLGA